MKAPRAIAALAAVIASAGSANAADLGGSCCADLEERIAELEATTARKGNRKVSLTVYGQVNQAVMFWDDQTESNTYVVNNKTSTTHVGFEGAAGFTPRNRAGFRVEFEVASANSDFVDQGVGPGFNGVGDEGRSGLVARYANWWIEDEKLGRVTVGLQSNATDNIAEMDLSKTSVVSLSSVETWNEGFFFRNANNGNVFIFPGVLALSGASASLIGDLYRGNFDGGRGNLVRYDTPVIAGFIASVAWGEDDDWDVGLRYAGEFSGFKMRGGIGYHSGKIVDTDNVINVLGGANAIPDHEEVVGSLSVLHDSTGLFVTFAGGSRNWQETPVAANPALDLKDEKYIYVKSGILRRWLPFGDTSIYGEYYRIWDVGIETTNAALLTALPEFNSRFDETAETFGFGVVQQIDPAAMELYLAYRHYKADDITGFSLNTLVDNDIRMDMIMSGARIKF